MIATVTPAVRRGLPTSYAGHVFRSRLEARFAVLFDVMGIRWEYEPDGFELPHGLYVPDFWLPDLRTWFEVKPDWDDAYEAFAITADLCRATERQVVLVPGLDAKGWGVPFFHVWRPPVAPRPRPDDGDFGYLTLAHGTPAIALTPLGGVAGPRMPIATQVVAATTKAKAATFERPDRIPAYPLVVR